MLLYKLNTLMTSIRGFSDYFQEKSSFRIGKNFYIFFASWAVAMCKFKLSFDLKKGTKCFDFLLIGCNSSLTISYFIVIFKKSIEESILLFLQIFPSWSDLTFRCNKVGFRNMADMIWGLFYHIIILWWKCYTYFTNWTLLWQTLVIFPITFKRKVLFA